MHLDYDSIQYTAMNTFYHLRIFGTWIHACTVQRNFHFPNFHYAKKEKRLQLSNIRFTMRSSVKNHKIFVICYRLVCI